MAALDMEDVARVLIEGGESYYVEYKSCWDYGPDGKAPRDIKSVAQDIGEAVVAFGNADGGDLLVGVEDSGTVTGLPWSGDRVEYLARAARTRVMDQVEVGVQVHVVAVDGQTVLLFRIPEYDVEPLVTADGRCLRRESKRSAPIRPEDVRRRRQHRHGDGACESEPIPAARLEDLDLELLQWITDHPDADAPALRTPAADPRRASRRPAPQSAQLSLFPTPVSQLRLFDRVLPLLRYWNLIEQRDGSVVLKRAALLLFARDPLRWHPNNRIRIRRVHGDDQGHGESMRTRETEVLGPIATSLPAVLGILTRELERESKRNALFATTQLLPSEAVQECLVNASAHRNYAIEGQAIEVLLYPDRVEVRSPGQLPDPITVEDLKSQRGVHRSRNPVIMRVLRDLGWTRDQGEGMARIFGSMRQVELHEPELEESSGTFIVRLSTRSRYDPSTQAWIASYGPWGLMPDERRYVIQLREAGGSLSVDKLARRLDESYDQTKIMLARLEHKHLVWHKKDTRTYNLVEPLNVVHERALRRFEAVGLGAEPAATLGRPNLATLAGTDDKTTLDSLIERWREAGILVPAGRGVWRLGASFRTYILSRGEG